MQAQEAWRYSNSQDQSCDVSRSNVGVTTLKGADVLALLRGTNRMLYSKIGNHVHSHARKAEAYDALLQLMKTTLSELARTDTYA